MVKRSSASSRREQLKSVSSAAIKSRVWTDRERQALRTASEAQAVKRDAGLDLSDIPRMTPTQLKHLVRLRGARRKVAVSVRLDPTVLEWLRSKGEGHLTRINDILMNLMEAEGRTGSGK
jgi:uncharacterized protein (DUF4415 family)